MKNGIRQPCRGFFSKLARCAFGSSLNVCPHRVAVGQRLNACRHREKIKCREIFALVTENPYTRKEKQSCL
jgi:hypothetical protein